MESLDHFNMKKSGGKLEIGLDGKTIKKLIGRPIERDLT